MSGKKYRSCCHKRGIEYIESLKSIIERHRTTDMEKGPMFRTLRDNARAMLGGNGGGTMEDKVVSARSGRREGRWGCGGEQESRIES